MCGITLYISKKSNAINYVLESLYELQNRGYDSFGIAYFDNSLNNFIIHKKSLTCIGNQDHNVNLYNEFKKETKDLFSNICIGHSRWATHGKINVENAHPHISNKKEFILIHNGIIENYKKLKDFLVKKGYTFYSETDSEIIVNLIEYFYLYERNQHIKEAIYHTISLLQGTYGLIILHASNNHVCYIIKHGSPLLVSQNNNEIMATSEISGFTNKTLHYYELNNNELVTLCKNKGIIFDFEIKNKKLISNEFKEQYLTQSLENYTHYIQKEIIEQDTTLWMTLNKGGRIKNNNICLGGLDFLKKKISKINNIVFIGCGSSYYASCVGYSYIKNITLLNDINIFNFDGGSFEITDIPYGICLFVFISQSGETMDLIKHINNISKHHYTMGIINVIDSTLAKEVQCGIYMNIGKEVSVASTKSFNSSLLLLKIFSLWLYQEKTKMIYSNHDFEYLQMNDYIKNQIKHINQMIYQVKKINNQINIILEDLNFDNLLQNHIFIIGRGSLEYIAKECALKMKEICYIHGEGINGSALKHGPLAMIHQYFPVILLINHNNVDKMINVYHELKSRNAYIFIITSEIDILKMNKKLNIIYFPKNNVCSEILIMLIIQHLCYEISIKKKINPDRPKNLAKVVSVE